MLTKKQQKSLAIVLAIVDIYVLDFVINIGTLRHSRLSSLTHSENTDWINDSSIYVSRVGCRYSTNIEATARFSMV